MSKVTGAVVKLSASGLLGGMIDISSTSEIVQHVFVFPTKLHRALRSRIHKDKRRLVRDVKCPIVIDQLPHTDNMFCKCWGIVDIRQLNCLPELVRQHDRALTLRGSPTLSRTIPDSDFAVRRIHIYHMRVVVFNSACSTQIEELFLRVSHLKGCQTDILLRIIGFWFKVRRFAVR